MAAERKLTERQEKWFASVRVSLEKETGRSLAEWVEIARSCPETRHRARLRWFKETHGLLQNRASIVLDAAFPADAGEAPADKLWADPAARALYEAVKTLAEALPDVVAGQRKSYSAWSRKVQFAALRPVKRGGVMLGLHCPPDLDPRLEAPRNESWSERLTARLALTTPDEVDGSVEALLKYAWERS